MRLEQRGRVKQLHSACPSVSSLRTHLHLI